MKFAKIRMIVLLGFTLALAGVSVQGQNEAMTTYNRIDEVMDWGPVTTMLIVNLQAEVAQGSVAADSFSVYVKRSDPRLEKPFLEEGDVNVVDTYISDAAGNPMEMGSFATLVLEISPTITLNYALSYGLVPGDRTFLNNWSENVYTITQEKAIGEIEGLVAMEVDQYSRRLIDAFKPAQSSYEDEEYGQIELYYAHYEPVADDAKHPLIVWLHGGGEGGTDPTIPLAGNKATVFVTEKVQAYFGGAYVLIPQSPTFWMDSGVENQATGAPKENALSRYTRAVQNLVESYVAENPGIDTNRIYVGGLSNGGFLTVRLILDYPDYYAAAVAVCEALDDQYVSDKEIAGIVDLPIWFVTAATDFVVPPHIFPVKLYNRLIQLGAPHVYMNYLPHVLDTSGMYTNADGSPYEYFGHFSWIYVYNNELAQVMDGKTVVGQLHGSKVESYDNAVTVLEWWAAQSK